MVNASEIYGSNGGDFINVEIARGERLLNKWLTIKDAEVREMKETDFKTGEQTDVQKIVLSFKEMDYEMPLNKTNARRLIADIDPETDTWPGSPIKLKVQMWGNGKEGLVIKSKQELEDDGEEIPSSSSSKILNPPTLKQLAKKYQAINEACERVSMAGFDMDNGGVYSELCKMKQEDLIFQKELDKYKKLLAI